VTSMVNFYTSVISMEFILQSDITNGIILDHFYYSYGWWMFLHSSVNNG